MKSILISIKPKWCEKIVNGEKTFEIRKTMPKQVELPFKVYVYESKDKKLHAVYKVRDYNWLEPVENPDDNVFIYKQDGLGKVIGEFTCDDIEVLRNRITIADKTTLIAKTCVPFAEIKKYANGHAIYLWHIKDFKLYDEPKCLTNYYTEKAIKDGLFKRIQLEKAPQSWCYVQEVRQ